MMAKTKDIVSEIGNYVNIGSGDPIMQGTRIAQDCVVASNAVLRDDFYNVNCIIGVNPSRIIK